MYDQGVELKYSYPNSWPQNKEYLKLLNAIARNRKPLCLMFNAIEYAPGIVDYETGIAAFIKYVRETLNLSEKDCSDLQLQEMIQPFGELIHGKAMLKHKELTETLRNRHFKLREATNNK